MAKSEVKNTDWQSTLAKLETILEDFFVKKLPGLPDSLKEFIVKISPWLSLIFLILSLPAILFTLGFGTLLSPFAFLGGIKMGMSFGLGLVFTAITVVMEALAIPGLFKRAMTGWRWLYWAALVSGVQSIVSFNLGGLIIGTGISLYFLFQIKSYYK
ncbi:chromate transporter [Candidatus Roizmanbacteria bacterium CG23_combo_of_CG06-09_8_20_14_all_35_49]|uniref:Chromate transporter n=1 Tax=Candidatus Roizmanbacteria bacterium CG23_combo_of_CG06-09_8_20_14_all_35_49 TaxID=1974863 RepID=A0A2G9Y5Z1_9BACT|nr:MAG: chromate transporter [Candidatus Roizmanbacteria bacterium CG23_combo_of_CG06-09_8_20_14_all_35_49]